MLIARNALLVVLCTTLGASADDKEAKKTAKALCADMNAATLKADYKKIVELTHPKLIERMGGKDKAVQAIAAGFDDLKSKGVTIKSIDVGEPSDVITAKDEMYLTVPINIEMTAATGKLRQKSYIVGVSTDKGKTWLFLAGDLGAETVKEILPNLPTELKLPPPQKPLIEK